MNDVSHPSDYERSDADPRLLGALALGVAAFLIATPYMLRGLYPGSDRVGAATEGLLQPPEPRLQVKPNADLARLRSSEALRLSSFGWIDRGHGVARMPIGRAMQLTAERGLAGWPSPAKPAGSSSR